MKAKIWIICWLIIVTSGLSWFGIWVYKVDPYFHYHKPDLGTYFYELNYQRGQNDGISKHFDYDVIISGTSMTENFKTTEVDRIFNCNSIKVPCSGGAYKEINDNVVWALEANQELNMVIRCLDLRNFFDAPDHMRTDLGEFPTYLYDRNPINDVEYLLNKDIVFKRVYYMILNSEKDGFIPGITSFDDYSRWQEKYSYGKNEVIQNVVGGDVVEGSFLSEDEKENIKENIEKNVTKVACEYPNVDFYYFYSPYSIVWWQDIRNKGTLLKWLEAEQYITELIVPYKNIHLFSFNNRTDIITDLNNYKDDTHYAAWINSLILKWMSEGDYQLTEDNYKEYCEQEYNFFTSFDYSSIDKQDDYEADFYAAALLNNELTGAEPLDVLNDNIVDILMNKSEYIVQGERNIGIECFGALSRNSDEEFSEYLREKEFIGIKFNVDLDDGYNYLGFNGRKISEHGGASVYVYDTQGNAVFTQEISTPDLDNKVHQYVIDLSDIDGEVMIVLNGGCIDNSGSSDSGWVFEDIYIY